MTFVSNSTQFTPLPLARAPHVSILRSPLVKKRLQGSTLRGWVFFILIRKLKHTKQEFMNHSKTWCNLRNILRRISKPLAWQGGSTANVAYRQQILSKSPITTKWTWLEFTRIFIFRNISFSKPLAKSPFRALIPGRSFTLLGNQIFIPMRQCGPEIFAFAQKINRYFHIIRKSSGICFHLGRNKYLDFISDG